jgi:hypothetical protein
MVVDMPSNLDVVERHFTTLTGGPCPLALDGARLGCGLPPKQMPLDELRVMLLKRQTSWLTKNAAWQELVRLAHAQPDPWIMAAAGVIVPGLKHIGGKLGPCYPGDPSDLDSEILEGFFQALDLAEPTDPKLYSQFYWAAFRRGHEACNREKRLARQRADLTEATRPAAPRPRTGHPDLVLANAMLDGAVTPRQADLVSGIHLGRINRSSAADRLGLSRRQIGLELAAAERKLVKYLSAATPDTAA